MKPRKQTVSLEELMVSTLAMTDAAVKLLIQERRFFTDAEFKTQPVLNGLTISPR
jgi:hypothetical protein